MKWSTPSQAKRQANRMTKKYGILFKWYTCVSCGHYHVGRRLQTVEYTQFVMSHNKDEMLVGKLIAALRLVLDHPK